MRKPFTHTYLLREFIDEIVRTNGAALAGTIAPPTAEAIESEFKAAALAGAQQVLGMSPPIVVELETELGEVRLYQLLRAVKTPADSKTETDLQAVRKWGREYADVKDGDLVRFALDYGDGWRANGGPIPPEGLYARLTEVLNEVACRYFPPPTFAEGTLAGLFANDGGWTKGVRAVARERRPYWTRTRGRLSRWMLPRQGPFDLLVSQDAAHGLK